MRVLPIAGLFVAIALTTPARADKLDELIEFMLPTAEEKAAFALEDKRRVDQLTSYVVGETGYIAVCGDWEVATDAHFNILGISKFENRLTIHMGRDLTPTMVEMEYGVASGNVFGREVFFEAMGGACEDKPNADHPLAFESDDLVQCELVFDDLVLTSTTCATAAPLPVPVATEPAALIDETPVEDQ